MSTPRTQARLYIAIDVGKNNHCAAILSAALLEQCKYYESCPTLVFTNTRQGFQKLEEWLCKFGRLDLSAVLMEITGHYQRALEQYLHEVGVQVYWMHAKKRLGGKAKTDKQDALSLANELYNQLAKGVQVADKRMVVRPAVRPTEAAARLAGLVRHRYELQRESTKRKNKLTAICDELFPELASVCKDPNHPSALALRKQYPTARMIAAATLTELCHVRLGPRPYKTQLATLQDLATRSIGVRDPVRQESLVREQAMLIAELELIRMHLVQLDREITVIVEQSREGQILTSIPGIGPVPAAYLISTIKNIDNFPRLSCLRSYLGWAVRVRQSGENKGNGLLDRGGNRLTKQILFMLAMKVVQMNCEWQRYYQGRAKKHNNYDSQKDRYKGSKKDLIRVASKIINVVYVLLKQDSERVRATPPGESLPDPILYDAALHNAHRTRHIDVPT